MRPSASTVITLSPMASSVAMARGFCEIFGRDRARHHFQRGQQQRRFAGTVDHGAGELHARHLALPIHAARFRSAPPRILPPTAAADCFPPTRHIPARRTRSAVGRRHRRTSCPSSDRKRALANRITLRCTSTASCTVSTRRWNSCSRSCSCAPRCSRSSSNLLTAAPSLPSAPGSALERYAAGGAAPRR